jgi:hypothetical protein
MRCCQDVGGTAFQGSVARWSRPKLILIIIKYLKFKDVILQVNKLVNDDIADILSTISYFCSIYCFSIPVNSFFLGGI